MARKTAYLTIDDAPTKDFRKKIDFLLKKRIPAIFFCRGDRLEKRGTDVIYAIKKGFIIGNHSYDHPRFSKLSLREALRQIKKTDRIIEEIYFKSGIKRPARLFRFPYGDKGGANYQKIQQFLKGLGYTQPRFENINYSWFKPLKKDTDIYWTFDIKEWCLKGSYDPKIKSFKDVLNLMQQKRHQNGGSLLINRSKEIILIHDHEETTKYFFRIIDKLSDMRIKFELPEFSN
jgi:peptidoglycan/xylan/chitin deacetylase (PgdA/CDA1 family)